MPTISVFPSDGCPGYLVSLDGTDRDILVQQDWDFPGLAMNFGASLRSLVRRAAGEPEILSEDDSGQVLQVYWCTHDKTDGTITCPDCGATASEFMSAAADYLDSGPDPVEDPGYFSDDSDSDAMELRAAGAAPVSYGDDPCDAVPSEEGFDSGYYP